MNKRGISNVVATTLIVLLTVSGVSVLWLGLGSFLDVDIRTFDSKISIITSTGYTFYDPQNGDGTVLVQVETRGVDIPHYIQLILTLDDGSEKVSVHDAPFSNSRTTLYLNAKDINPQKVSVAPIFVIDGKAILGTRVKPIDLPRRNEEQVTFYSSFSNLREPDGVYVEQGPLASGGGGGSENTGKPGSSIPKDLCPLVTECQDQDGDGIADLPESCFGGTQDVGGEDYYTICSCEDLQMIDLSSGGITENNDGNNLNDNYILMNDIYCSLTNPATGGHADSMWDSEGFDPIGVGGFSDHYTGIFDGNDYEIRDLFIDRSGSVAFGVGLFAELKGTVKDVSLVNVDVTGFNAVGGLTGYHSEEGKISNVAVTGSVTSVGTQYVGGLVGISSPVFGSLTNEILDSSFEGSVEGQNNVGGLVGSSTSSIIQNSHVSGTVEGANNVGGLVGSNGGSASISESYATANVDATGDNVGGLVGSVYFSEISESYATGDVSGVESVGGLVGYFEASADSGGFIENSYSSSSVTASFAYAAGLVGTSYYTTSINPSSPILLYSYFIGSVMGSTQHPETYGVRNQNLGGDIINSYYDSDIVTCGGAYNCADELSWGRLTSQLQSQSYLSGQGWDFTPGTGAWKYDSGISEYPILSWQND